MAKATKKQALGRGLSSILNKDSNSTKSLNFNKRKSTIDNIDINLITVNPYQSRSNFNEKSLKELTTSIKNIGVIQPITVRKIKKNSYQLISGERRLKACKNLELNNIPAYIRTANDQESLEMALIENIHRQDLDAIEIAVSYKRLIDEINLTQEELSNKIGKDRTTITNYLRLLKLNPIIQSGIKDGFISMGHGRSIINIENKSDQIKVYETIISKNLSVRNTEELVKNYKKNQVTKKSIDKPKYISDAITKLSEILKTSVRINISRNNQGNIIIPFKSEAEFKKINKKLNDS
ncbi:MAG: ParB/RepB/Spo0J family partition protein [Flavobacteriaceae bacterium]|jgi:ParB family transcriptional regulator, chromosome partitioning protein|nr:ParB/RepB/Spo0J family partition protein [Flavobacteriaceae bacterium]MBT4113329.1 ParB/RepB/Spo0J family partition protein [Flavobacteriaceae bacterium]MBT4614736.1 ParB/RepB/Spo0J family partition protein [Flavobacteriaceae bacterium]MBT5247066.1 ParB/RepB/Spo0J family partition protein [Flavobacteriaceae bacterium]MBT5649722.1 ParB/RepB/Spo0J family partition protein [Flavobacteriaceae bacterium]